MINFATKNPHARILVWLIWFVVLFVFHQPTTLNSHSCSLTPAAAVPLHGLVSHDPQNGSLFPWQPLYRWKQRAARGYRTCVRVYRRARWAAYGAGLALRGAVTLAQIVAWFTWRQRHYQVGALPVLYALLETLRVRQIINRHCPTRSGVDHGTVALVLILNRLMFPLPLYQVADWVGRTVLTNVLAVPAAKFNDDRLGRALDALYPHLETIWLAVVEQAICKADIDLSLIFYDLTAFIAHGQYPQSEQIDFGFAHNTPMDKRKFKLGLNVAADGAVPWRYHFLPGRTADMATVAGNMNNLADWLKRRGYRLADTLVVGDRAMLNDEIAVAYDRRGLRYLAGLRCLRTGHKALLRQGTEAQLQQFPLEDGDNPQYWGRGCTVRFEYEGRTVYHRGLVILAGPLRDQLRQNRREQLAQLDQELQQLRLKLGQPYHRTIKSLQRKVNSCCRSCPASRFMTVTVYETAEGAVNLHWQVDEAKLRQVERGDGRYLLVTNDSSLNHRQMFDYYRQKDGVEKRFQVCKGDLQISPVRLHQDKRIATALLLNMIALLAYSLLERQMRQTGLQLTTRQLIKRLEGLTLIETVCHDGSSLRRMTPIEPAVSLILQLVAEALDDLMEAPDAKLFALPALPAALRQLSPPTMERLC